VAELRRKWSSIPRAGWSLGYVSAGEGEGRTIRIADVQTGDGKHLVVRADEKLSAFVFTY